MSIERVEILLRMRADTNSIMSPEFNEGFHAGLLRAFDLPVPDSGFRVGTCQFDSWMFGHEQGRELALLTIKLASLNMSIQPNSSNMPFRSAQIH